MNPDESDRRNEAREPSLEELLAYEAMYGPESRPGLYQTDDTDPDFWRDDVEEGPVSS